MINEKTTPKWGTISQVCAMGGFSKPTYFRIRKFPGAPQRRKLPTGGNLENLWEWDLFFSNLPLVEKTDGT